MMTVKPGRIVITAVLLAAPTISFAADQDWKIGGKDSSLPYFQAFKAVCMDQFGNRVAQIETATSERLRFKHQGHVDHLKGDAFMAPPIRVLLLGDSETESRCALGTTLPANVTADETVEQFREIAGLTAAKTWPTKNGGSFWIVQAHGKRVIISYEVRRNGDGASASLIARKDTE